MENVKIQKIGFCLAVIGLFLSILIFSFFHDSRAVFLFAICSYYLNKNKPSTIAEGKRREWFITVSLLVTLFIGFGGVVIYLGYFIYTNIPK